MRLFIEEHTIEIKRYDSSDCKERTERFYQTVHKVNVKDDTKEQQVERQGILLTNYVMTKDR